MEPQGQGIGLRHDARNSSVSASYGSAQPTAICPELSFLLTLQAWQAPPAGLNTLDLGAELEVWDQWGLSFFHHPPHPFPFQASS